MKNENKKLKIGIIGDGQLALMLAESLNRQKIDFLCLSQNKNSPMNLFFPSLVTMDEELFCNQCDVFTLENELTKSKDIIKLLGAKSTSLFPSIESYEHFSNKKAQRLLYEKLNIPSPKWKIISNNADHGYLLNQFRFPFIMKATQGGYDGKGVRVINNREDYELGLNNFGFNEGKEILIEEKINIQYELAQGFLQNQQKKKTLLPLVETVQNDGICHFVYYPALISENVRRQINQAMEKLMYYPLIGIFNFEFFVDDKEKVYINEGAPRPHNSQHLTLNASNYSQFDLLANYLTQKESPTNIETKKAAMINLLGKSQGEKYQLQIPEISSDINIYPKLYGKKLCSPGRKMGHINLVDLSGQKNLRELADYIFKGYSL